LPLVNYLCNCEPSQIVEIPIVENFNNAEFQLNSIEFTLTHTEVSFNSAVVKLRTSLFGIRYFMRNWFFTSALVAITISTISLSVFFIGFYFALRTALKLLFTKLYPNKVSAKYIKKKLNHVDISQEQTDDLFTSGDSDSDRD
jgi:hypothetical protein